MIEKTQIIFLTTEISGQAQRFFASVLLLGVWHGEQNSLDRLAHLRAGFRRGWRIRSPTDEFWKVDEVGINKSM